jgi:hypothetical protein
MGLDRLIIGQINNATANAFKMQLSVDSIKDKVIDTVSIRIEDEIPFPLPFNISVASALKQEQQIPKKITKELLLSEFPPQSTGAKALKSLSPPQKDNISNFLDEIEALLNQNIKVKNTLTGALNTILKPIDTISKLVSTLNKVIPTLKTVVTVIKALPIPTSVPPGIGIPVNVINGFSSSLIAIDKALSKLEGPIGSADTGIKGIQTKVRPIVGKLRELDPIFASSTQIIIIIRILLEYGDKLDTLTEENINSVATSVTSKQELSQAITPGPLSSETDDAANAAANAALEESLKPGSNNPLIYKGFKLELQYDPNNPYSFPSRRIYGKFQNQIIENSLGLDNNQNNLLSIDQRLLNSLKDSEIYNLPAITVTDSNDVRVTEETQGHPYSFSSTTQVLLSEIYYEIDQLILGNESLIKTQNENVMLDQDGRAVGVVYNRFGESLAGTPGNAIYYVLKLLGLYSPPTILPNSSPSGLDAASTSTSFVDTNLEPLPSPNSTLTNNLGLVFKEYVEYALDKNIVRDAKGGQVGRIQGEYGVVLKFGGGSRSTSDVTPRTPNYHDDIKGIFGDQAQKYVLDRNGRVFQSYKDANPPGTGKRLNNAQIDAQGGGLLAAGPLAPIVYYPFGVAGSPGEVRRNTDGSYFRFYSSNPDPNYANTALFLSASGILGATNSNEQLSASTGWFSITPPPTTPFNSYGTTPGEVRRNTEVFQPGGYQVSNAYRWNNTTYVWEDNFTGTGIGGSNTTYFPDPFDRVGNYIGEYAYVSGIDTFLQIQVGPNTQQYITRYIWEQDWLPNSNEKGYRWIWQGTSWTQDSSQTLPQTNGQFSLKASNPNIYGRVLDRGTAQRATNNHSRFVEIIPPGPQGQTPLIKYTTKLYS